MTGFVRTALIGLALGGLGALTGCDVSTVDRTQRSTENASGRDSGRSGSEERIVTICEMVLRDNLVSRSSLDFLGHWQFAEDERYGHVRRDYEAQNALGAMITSRYDCTVELSSMSLVSLSTTGPAGEDVLYFNPSLAD